MNAAGNLEPEAWERAQQGHFSYMTKHLGLWKTNNMNVCRKCEGRYYKAAEHTGCAKNAGGAHTPMYDWTLSEDPMNCEIPQ